MSPRLLNMWSSSLMSKWCIGTCRICIYCIFHITRHPNVTHRGENYRCDRLNKYNDPLRSFELGYFFYDEAFKAYKADRGVCCVCSSCLCVSVLCAFFWVCLLFWYHSSLDSQHGLLFPQMNQWNHRRWDSKSKYTRSTMMAILTTSRSWNKHQPAQKQQQRRLAAARRTAECAECVQCSYIFIYTAMAAGC